MSWIFGSFRCSCIPNKICLIVIANFWSLSSSRTNRHTVSEDTRLGETVMSQIYILVMTDSHLWTISLSRDSMLPVHQLYWDILQDKGIISHSFLYAFPEQISWGQSPTYPKFLGNQGTDLVPLTVFLFPSVFLMIKTSGGKNKSQRIFKPDLGYAKDRFLLLFEIITISFLLFKIIFEIKM